MTHRVSNWPAFHLDCGAKPSRLGITDFHQLTTVYSVDRLAGRLAARVATEMVGFTAWLTGRHSLPARYN